MYDHQLSGYMKLLYRAGLGCLLLILITSTFTYTCQFIFDYRSLFSPRDIAVFNDICEVKSTSRSQTSDLTVPPDSYLLFILVLSRPEALERRNAIRSSWMEAYSKSRGVSHEVVVKFSIGTKNLSKSLITQLNSEQELFSDLLLLHNHSESYSNLSGKVLASFIQINMEYPFMYLLKCDDDTFVVVDILVQELKLKSSRKSYYWGKILNRQKVLTSGKFAEKQWFLTEMYLPYAIGAGYILSGDLVRCISLVSNHLMLYHNEDVSVSVWISPYNVERVNDNRVCENMPGIYYQCRKSAIILHPISAQEMISLQRAYTNKCKLQHNL